jgi:DNA mismatch repair ATPase MutS
VGGRAASVGFEGLGRSNRAHTSLPHTHFITTGMPDIERLNRKLEAHRASLADLCQLYRASAVLPRLEEALRCHEVHM